MKDLSDYYAKALNIGVHNVRRITIDPNILNNDHQNYQRNRIEDKVLHHMKHWDKEDYNSGIVAMRPDGSYWLINGQHHSDAAVRLGISVVQYYIFNSTDWTYEKGIFDLFQKLQSEEK